MKQISGAIAGFCSCVLAMTCHAEATLHPIEIKWIAAAESVLDFAADEGLPIDIIVQPVSTGADAPLAMGVRDQRCKLIFSLRDKADAEASLQGAPLEQHAMLIEVMVAHEVAHCWRFMQGTWHTSPAAFIEPANESRESFEQQREMQVTQREEGYADLVALAWTLKNHPQQYAAVHAWLTEVRHDQPITGSYHDTRVWLQLAKDPAAFPSANTLFDQVEEIWRTGSRNQR